jgi:hypothetical protein
MPSDSSLVPPPGLSILPPTFQSGVGDEVAVEVAEAVGAVVAVQAVWAMRIRVVRVRVSEEVFAVVAVAVSTVVASVLVAPVIDISPIVVLEVMSQGVLVH